MRFTASAFLSVGLLLFGDMARAQPQESEPTQEQMANAWSQFFFEEVLLRSCDDPTLKTAIALPQPKLNVEVTDKGKLKLNARAGFKVKKSFVFDLEVESPKKDPGETTLATLDGLSNETKADLKLSWFGWRPQKTYKYLLEKIASPEGATAGNSSEDDAMKEMVGKAPGTGWSMADYLKPAVSRPSAVALLGPEKYKEDVATYQKWMRNGYNRFIPVLTLAANAEQKESQFFLPSAGPPAGLKKNSEFHMNHLLTASTGAYLWGRFYSSLNYSRGTQYTDGAHQEFCTPTGAARVLDCMSLPIAPPKKETSEELAFEIRGLAGNLGLGAHVTRDLEANVTKIEIPVYLLQKLGTSKMELNLGARAQWRSDTKDIAVSVFLGPALSTVLRMFDRQ